MAEARQLFGERFALVHQSALRHTPRATYNALAQFLGTESFSASATFHRYNAHRGKRTDLCNNASFLQALKRRLAPEYRALAEVYKDAGLNVPQELRLKQTRCDWPEDLREGAESCTWRQQCAGP